MDKQVRARESNSLSSLNLADFERLQEKLVPLWQQIGTGPGGPVQEPNTAVVVPSLSFDVDEPASTLQAYEQRFLFLLFLLRQPNLRLTYVTSQPIQESIIDYYLDLLPGIVSSHARKRLDLICLEDGSREPLSQKLLARPHVLARIRALIPNADMAHMIPFNTTDLEREVALRLGIPMYAADPDCFAFGTKSGGRRVFAEEDVPHPLGQEDLYSEESVVQAIRTMRTQRPAMEKVIVKLNEGVSGMGNATVDLAQCSEPGAPSELDAIAQAVRGMQFELSSVRYEDYVRSMQEDGAIVEELIAGRTMRSPSAQLRITPLGEVELLSTHDQILGGPSGQTYLGARFPADAAYAWPIMEQAEKIGQRLAREGVIGRFAVDFVVVQGEAGQWQPYAIEVNLRKGGTTAPHLTLEYLTDGRYHAHEGAFHTVRGDERCYVASDHLESPAYRVFTPDSLFDIVSRHRLHFDHARQTGVVMHMLCDVGASGRIGATVIAPTHEEADALYDHFVAVLDQEASLCWEV